MRGAWCAIRFGEQIELDPDHGSSLRQGSDSRCGVRSQRGDPVMLSPRPPHVRTASVHVSRPDAAHGARNSLCAAERTSPRVTGCPQRCTTSSRHISRCSDQFSTRMIGRRSRSVIGSRPSTAWTNKICSGRSGARWRSTGSWVIRAGDSPRQRAASACLARQPGIRPSRYAAGVAGRSTAARVRLLGQLVFRLAQSSRR